MSYRKEDGLPRQCAHWLAMTCRRQKGVSGCKDVARNAMQKEGRVRGCKDAARKVRGNMPGVSGARHWFAMTPPPCHCEERSDGTIRSPAVAQSKEQRLRRIRESAYGFALGAGFRFVVLQGETDCRVAVHPPRSSQWQIEIC